jgi:hypothetical protein
VAWGSTSGESEAEAATSSGVQYSTNTNTAVGCRLTVLVLGATHYSRYKFETVSLPKRFRNGRFNSETAVRRFKK